MLPSTAAAFAWEFKQRHRWGWIALGVYVVLAAIVKMLIFDPRGAVIIRDAVTLAMLVVVPMTFTFIYLLSVFSFGLSGDLAARQSIYPARMFTLPVTNTALAGWPMLYGAIAMLLLWTATRLLTNWPSDVHIPTAWPALLAASLLAWTQALTWMSYPLRGMRVIVTILWLVVIDAIVMIALEYKAAEGVMLLILAPHLPLAFVTARAAVARARRGDVPDWHRVRATGARSATPFHSAAQAQRWFEWREHGRVLPALVAILLPFELAMFFVFPDTPVIVIETLIAILSTPPFMAAFVAATVRRSNPPFVLTRPIDNTSLIGAKFRVTMKSALMSWLLVLAAIPIGLRLSGTSAIAGARWHSLVLVVGMPRAVVIVLLVLAALIASTWKQLVQSLYVGLSGREWVLKASVFATISLLAIVPALAHWIFTDKRVFAFVWNGFPLFAAFFVAIKIAAAARIVTGIQKRQLLSDRTLIVAALLWNVCVFALYALLCWIVPELIVRHYIFAVVAILMIPLARVAAAPLALARSRHEAS